MDESLTILLVEDQPDEALLVQDALRGDPHFNWLQVVTSGEEAIEYLSGTGRYSNRATYPFPAIMLLDLAMPGIGGVGVLRWQQEHAELLENLQTVILTSHSESKDLQLAATLGAKTYWIKSDWPLLKQRLHLLMAREDAT